MNSINNKTINADQKSLKLNDTANKTSTISKDLNNTNYKAKKLDKSETTS